MKLSNPFNTVRNFIRPQVRPTIQAATRPQEQLCSPMDRMDEPLFPMQDKTLLLRPLNDDHLIEVYREAKAMRLSEDFILLIESALRQRNIIVLDQEESPVSSSL